MWAEACFLVLTVLTIENVMDHLLHADSKNCALLKEAVIDSILENKVEVLNKVLLKDVTRGLFANLLAASARTDETIWNATNSKDPFQYHSSSVRHLLKYLVARASEEAILNSPSNSVPESAPLEAVLTTEHVLDHRLYAVWCKPGYDASLGGSKKLVNVTFYKFFRCPI